MRNAALVFVTLIASTLLVSTHASVALARAPDTFEEAYSKPAILDSPMWWALELKTGPYRPGDTGDFKRVFGSDQGWLYSFELDLTLFHIPTIGQFNLGAGVGWAKYSAKAFAADNVTRAGEKTQFVMYPMSALGVLRVDSLARYTVVPVTFAAKVGCDFVRWKTKTGIINDANGLNIGLRWALQAAFELDFFDREAAGRMDEEWGINHVSALIEYFDSVTRGTGGGGLTFGVSAQY